MKRCNRCRGSHLQCADCLLEDGPTLLARAEKAEARVKVLEAALQAIIDAPTLDPFELENMARNALRIAS